MMNQIGGVPLSPVASPRASGSGKNGPMAIGSPFNFEKRLHVDGEFNWFGDGDPREMFEIQEKLGEGAFGAVFKAVMKQTGFVMAIKEILVGKLNDRNSIQKEINMLRQCRHRNTVQYFGCCNVDEDSIWILNDYCGAGSISDCIQLTESTFSEPQIAIVVAAALEGLAFLHKRNIVHRDVKCANILITENGVVKIGDFGVSEKLTQTVCVRNSIVGTPYWMSPEVITGSDYGTEADIWSLGITTIEMTDGVPPHSTVHPMRAMFKIPFLPPPTLLQPSAYSKEFNDFIAHCLIKDPKKRPSAQDLLHHPFISRYVGQQHNSELRKPLMEKVREVMARRAFVKNHGQPKAGKVTVITRDVKTGQVTVMEAPDRADLLQPEGTRKPRGLSGSSVGSHGTVVIHSEDEGEANALYGEDGTSTVMIHDEIPIYGSPEEAPSKGSRSMAKISSSLEVDGSSTMVIHSGASDVDVKLRDNLGTVMIHQGEDEVHVRLKENEDDADIESDGDEKIMESQGYDVDAEFLITGGPGSRGGSSSEQTTSVGGPRYARRLSDATDDEHLLFVSRKQGRPNVAAKLRKRLEKFRKTLKGNVGGVHESGDERDYTDSRPSVRTNRMKSRSFGASDSTREYERVPPPSPSRQPSDFGSDRSQHSVTQHSLQRKRRADSTGTVQSSLSNGDRSESLSSADSPRRSGESSRRVTDSSSHSNSRLEDSNPRRRALTKMYEVGFGMATHRTASDTHADWGRTPRLRSPMGNGHGDGDIDVNELVRIHDNLLKEIAAAKRAETARRRWWSLLGGSHHLLGQSRVAEGDDPPILDNDHYGTLNPRLTDPDVLRRVTGRQTRQRSATGASSILSEVEEQVVAGEVAGWAMRIPLIDGPAAAVIGSTAVLVWKIGTVLFREFRGNLWLHMFYFLVITSILVSR
ncbi:hypothetical protein HDU90_006289 [Geranomyces variabilis]|nr:hypothetical protein HDU90_006289 [Geranomyces variabilis]